MTAFVDALAELTFAVHDVLTRTAAEHDLSVTQLRLLGLLRDRTPSMAAIATHLHLDRSSVSGLVDRAEARGLVARSTSPDDARVTLVSVTPAGTALIRQGLAEITHRLDDLTANVAPDDRAALIRVRQSVTY